MSSSASAVPPPVAPPPPTVTCVIWPVPERDAVAGGEGVDVARASSPPPTSRGGRRCCPPRSRSTSRGGRTSTPAPDRGHRARRCCPPRPLMAVVQLPAAGWAARAPAPAPRERRVRCGHGPARLRDARRRLRRTERVESEDPFDLRRHRRVHLGCRRVVVAGLSRGQAVLRDRRREGGLHLGDRARDGQRQAGGRWRPHRQARLLEAGRDLRDRGRRRSESCANCLGVRKWRYSGDFGSDTCLRLCRQRGGITRLERDGERQGRRRRCRPDKGGSGGNEALMAGQLLAPGAGGCGTRRGRGAERGTAKAQRRPRARARTRRHGAADLRDVDPPSSARPPQVPPGLEG